MSDIPLNMLDTMVARLLMWRDLEPPSFGRGSGKKMAKTDHLWTLAAAGVLVAVGMRMLTMLMVVEPGAAGATLPDHNGKLKV